MKEIEKSVRKVYVIDIGFYSNLSLKTFKDMGRILENIVYLHLIRNFEQVYYYETKNKMEVDFITKNNINLSLIEATYEIDEEHYKKVFRALNELKLKKGIIVSWDTEDSVKKNSLTIEVVPAWKFLLMINLSLT